MRAFTFLNLCALTFGAALPKEEAPNPTGRYLVVLSNQHRDSSRIILNDHINNGIIFSEDVGHVWQLRNFKGYAARLDQFAMDRLRRDERVRYVEADGMAFTGSDTEQCALGSRPHQPYHQGKLAVRVR